MLSCFQNGKMNSYKIRDWSFKTDVHRNFFTKGVVSLLNCVSLRVEEARSMGVFKGKINIFSKDQLRVVGNWHGRVVEAMILLNGEAGSRDLVA